MNSGYCYGDAKAGNPQEAETVRRIVALRRKGLSVPAIARALNAAGVPARGTRWHVPTLYGILKRESQPYGILKRNR